MIAIIPARGGSKRIPRKNVKNYLGRPIISHTISIARDSGLFKNIYVSTEDLEIARVASDSGAEVLHRKQSLADDHTTTVEVISNAISELDPLILRGTELVCCIYPVNPNLSGARILEGKDLLQSQDLDYVFTAKKFESSPARSLRLGEDGRSEMHFPNFLNTRSQDLPEYFHDAAMFYLGKTLAWMEKKPVLFGNSKFIVLDKYETLDVDDDEDWIMMEELHSVRKKFSKQGLLNG